MKSLDWPENIIPIFQPPHSRELNPIERVWQWLKRQLECSICDSLIQLRHKLSELLQAIILLADLLLPTILFWRLYLALLPKKLVFIQ